MVQMSPEAVSTILERIVRLEVRQKNQDNDLTELKGNFKELTTAVNKLTSVLEQGKGVKLFLYMVILILPLLSAVTGFIIWLKGL